ncbi:MAG: CAP domain-containing protein [Paludibacteraceae bacterium]
MRKNVATILMLCLVAIPLAAQQWTSEQLAQANTARDASYLSEQEKQVIFLCNLARMDGSLFAATYLAQHTPNDPSNWYISSLYRDLQTVKNRQLLYPDKRLYATAAYHAADMGRTGRTGHTSSDGTSFADRVYGGLGERNTYIAENCSYGYNNDVAINIVIQLLVDQNTSSLGHRKNILNPDLNAIGVAIAPHKTYKFNCVMDFAKLANVRR